MSAKQEAEMEQPHYLSFTEKTRPLDLYEKAKRSMWNPATDLDWSKATGPTQDPKLQRVKMLLMSSLYYGELRGLQLAAKSLVLAEKEEDAIYFSMQTLEEARHIEALGRYLTVLNAGYEPNPNAVEAMDEIIHRDTFGELVAGNSVGSELWANEIYSAITEFVKPFDPWLSDLAFKILGDESRHVSFGHQYFQRREYTPEERKLNQFVTDGMTRALGEFTKQLPMVEGLVFKPLLYKIMRNIQQARKKVGAVPQVTEI